MLVTAADAIAYGLRASQVLLRRMVGDLKPHEFEFQPCAGANCVSWILGHLAVTDRRTLAWLGVTDLPAVPDGFVERFTVTRAAAGEQRDLGDPAELVRLFEEHRDRILAVLPTVDPARFADPPSVANPLFADKGEGYLFMGLHTAMHTGQVSMVRRALGYPPVR